MEAKSSTPIQAAESQETPSCVLMQKIKNELDEMIARRKRQGDYNVDSADMRRICELLRLALDCWP